MRKIMSLCLMLMCQLALMGQARIGADPDYNPSNPDDPQSPITKYTLVTEVTPQYCGSTNYSSAQRYAEGANVYLSAHGNTGYRFVHWLQGDSVVSSSASFYYTMPAKNVTLTAVFKYHPDSPANPDSLGIYYRLTVEAQPTYGGTFNVNSTEVMEGHTTTLQAYSNTGYRFKGWKMGDTIVSTSSSYTYKMKNKDVHIIGLFEYNPSNPENPNKNYWDKTTGEVIVDDFTAGNLYAAITAAIGGSGSSYRNKVKKITVAGEMSSSDFGIANNFTNCSIVDISRTYGYTEIPSYAYDYNTSLQQILLPACVTTIGYRAFYQCTNLAEISCYAGTPPAVDGYAFYGIADRVVVHVPYSSIQSYSEAEGWKNFVIESFSVEPTIEDFTFTDNLDVTYNGQPYEFPISSVPGMGKISVRYTDTLGVESTEGPTAIGKYYVSIDVEKGEYFTAASFDNIASFTIYVMDDVEWSVLQELYRATGGTEHWNTKWDIEGGIAAAASFKGIVYKKGHIIELNLSSNNLVGELPISVLTLPYLEKLQMQNNSLTGNIGKAIQIYGNLNHQKGNIRHLNISYNEITGNIGTITNCCPHLEYLYAKGNYLTDVYPILPKTMNLDLSVQTINTPFVWDGMLTYEANIGGLINIFPTLLVYNHISQGYSAPVWRVEAQSKHTAWSVRMSVDTSNYTVRIETDGSNRIFYGASGDTLEVTTLSPTVSSGSKAKIVYKFEQGDADFSSKIDVLDLQSIINYIFKEYQYYPFNHTAANLQLKDDVINVLDVIALVDLLMSETASVESLSQARERASTNAETDAETYLYWEGNRLVLETTKDIATLDISLQGGGTLQWNEALGMTAACAEKDTYQRIISYSMAGKYIPQGKHVLLTATAPCEVATALMADRTAQKVEVALKAPEHTEVEAITPVQVQCRYQDGWLQLCVDGVWEDMQWEVYTTDGRQLAKGTLHNAENGVTNLWHTDTESTVIVLVRDNNGMVLTQKINTIK